MILIATKTILFHSTRPDSHKLTIYIIKELNIYILCVGHHMTQGMVYQIFEVSKIVLQQIRLS